MFGRKDEERNARTALTMTNDDFAAGASAARNKLAAYLRAHGVDVRTSRSGRPPDDDDFLAGVRVSLRREEETG
jgi:hypothetical protein